MIANKKSLNEELWNYEHEKLYTPNMKFINHVLSCSLYRKVCTFFNEAPEDGSQQPYSTILMNYGVFCENDIRCNPKAYFRHAYH